MMKRACWAAAMAVMLTVGQEALAETASRTLANPAKWTYTDELVRLKVAIKTPYDSTKLVVREDGKEVPYQVEVLDGKPEAVTKGEIWVCTTLAGGASHQYEVTTGGTPVKSEPKVKVTPADGGYTLDNGLVALKIAGTKDAPGPIAGIHGKDGIWGGASKWSTATPVATCTATVTGSQLFGQVKVRYTFAGATKTGTPPWAEFTYTLKPGQPLVHVEESHDMAEADYWEMDVTKGWNARQCMIRPNNDGGGPGGNSPGNSLPKDKWPTTLKAGQTRMGDTHLLLLPRWSQAFDDGWFFGVHDGKNLVGAIPARAGKWVWPHDNKIAAKVRDTGDYAGLRAPTFRGSRYWLLVAGPVDLGQGDGPKDLVTRTAMQPLDKIVNDYISEWPGQKGSFQGSFFFGQDTNPTGVRRGMARSSIAAAGNKGNLDTLFSAQVNLDPDWYGSYYTYWSPENPNFFTDFIKTPVALVAQLRDHPRFPELRALAEAKLREDLDHSVTLPGGAGQECPGYLQHAVDGWRELAPVCKNYLGFDPASWPRYQAALSFQKHVSYPDGNTRRQNPAGDTHPGKGEGPHVIDMAGEDPTKLVTEELPGFGVVLRNKAGTPQETYVAFKSGPNRGHYHGDQLAFHLCFNAHPVAVDHHCSYNPRAGQEHMHNRVAFSLVGQKDFAYANMDGYERVIALATSPDADIAVGQVESPRLRAVDPLPPETWDARWTTHELKTPLIYRRTLALVKGGPKDYLVIRDQYWSTEKDLAAHWQLHVLGDKTEQNGPVIKCNGLSTFVAQPAAFKFEKFPWQHENGGKEQTSGPRLTVPGAEGQFITVLYPGETPPKMEAIKDGVKVGDDEITFGDSLNKATEDTRIAQASPLIEVRRGGKVVTRLLDTSVNFDRSQGDIGLFVPDAGYPFGPIPDWLIKQRANRNANAK